MSTALDVPKRIFLFNMCQLWALHVVIKRQFFYIYYKSSAPLYHLWKLLALMPNP